MKFALQSLAEIKYFRRLCKCSRQLHMYRGSELWNRFFVTGQTTHRLFLGAPLQVVQLCYQFLLNLVRIFWRLKYYSSYRNTWSLRLLCTFHLLNVLYLHCNLPFYCNRLEVYNILSKASFVNRLTNRVQESDH